MSIITNTTIPTIVYPTEDDEPMAETSLHVDAIIQLREFLFDLLAGRDDFFIGTDQFWYWEEGNPDARRAPDVMVIFGVRRDDARASFQSWNEGGAIPAFICEFSSGKTWRNDLGEKFDLYERLGVREYFLFDPEALYLRPQLQGWRLQAGLYHPIRMHEDNSLLSETLHVRLQTEGARVRVLDALTGEKHLTRLERSERDAKELEKANAEIARLKAQLEAVSKKSLGE